MHFTVVFQQLACKEIRGHSLRMSDLQTLIHTFCAVWL